jgi:hypothetical protein
MDWETIAFVLGDMESLYHISPCYAERHTYNETQRNLLLELSNCIDSLKEQAEIAIAKILMGVEKNE